MYTFVNRRYVYYLTPPKNFGLLGYLQGYLSNTTRRFSRLLRSVNYSNFIVRMIFLNMARKAETYKGN
jgi:hypothetical protein